MKNSLILFSLLITGTVVCAQNKTLGVGVASPNPNAALHVESPTNNQGFIMPRLTTAQRTAPAFVSSLSVTDIGLMVFDTDLVGVYVWEGTQWSDESISATITSSIGNSGYFAISNPANANNTLEATTNGTGGAAKFTVTNTASVMPALWAETNSNQPLSAPIFGLNTGTGDVAASFKINNAASTFPALYAETNGTGRGAIILKTNTGGSQPGLFVSTEGGRGIWANHNGATGQAGIFQNINLANTTAALFAEAVGSGPSIWTNKDPGESGNALEATHSGNSGNAGKFVTSNATNTSEVLYVDNYGRGSAGWFSNSDAANNTSPALYVQNAGGHVALFAVNAGSVSSAGEFQINNAANGSAAISLSTSGTGQTLFANHTGSSGNLAVFQNSSSNVARIDKTGKGFFNGGTQTGGADVAEMFEVEGVRNEYEPGDVLVISDDADRTVEKSNMPNSTKIAGVYATKPGVVLTERDIEQSLNDLVPMGVIGVIPTKVCLENGPIKRGDLLVTSSVKGHAMRAIPAVINGIEIYPTGAILGKALENFETGDKGLINVLVNVK